MANEKIPYIMTESIVDLPAPVKKKISFSKITTKSETISRKKLLNIEYT